MLKYAKNFFDLPKTILSKSEQANAFYSKEFAAYERKRGSEILYVFNDSCVQIVSIHVIKHVFVSVNFPSEPFVAGDNFSEIEISDFLDDVLDLISKKYHADWLTVTPASSVFKAYPKNSERICFGNYIINLQSDEEALFSAADSKHRNMIRRGIKGGVEICFGASELLEDYLYLDKQTWARSGEYRDNSGFYKEYVESMPSNTIVGIAYKDGTPQCGLIGLYNKAMFYYMFGASADRPEPGSTHLLQWEMIKEMKRRGVKEYSFVGCRINVDRESKLYNIQHFKKGFGGELRQCYLFRATMHMRKRKLFEYILERQTGKKCSDIIDQEIDKWRDIN